MVLKQDGSVWVTGRNSYGQLGDGTTTATSTFIQVIPRGVTAVAAGDACSMVVKQDSSVWAVGSNYWGQLGDGTRAHKSVFTKVFSLTTRTQCTGPNANAPAKGGVSRSDLDNHGSKATFTCKDGFRVDGANPITCTAESADAAWPSPPQCTGTFG